MTFANGNTVASAHSHKEVVVVPLDYPIEQATADALPSSESPRDIPTLTGEAVLKHHQNLASHLGDMLAEKQRTHDAEQTLRQKLHDAFVAHTMAYIEKVQENGKAVAADITKQMRESEERVRAMEVASATAGALQVSGTAT